MISFAISLGCEQWSDWEKSQHRYDNYRASLARGASSVCWDCAAHKKMYENETEIALNCFAAAVECVTRYIEKLLYRCIIHSIAYVMQCYLLQFRQRSEWTLHCCELPEQFEELLRVNSSWKRFSVFTWRRKMQFVSWCCGGGFRVVQEIWIFLHFRDVVGMTRRVDPLSMHKQIHEQNCIVQKVKFNTRFCPSIFNAHLRALAIWNKFNRNKVFTRNTEKLWNTNLCKMKSFPPLLAEVSEKIWVEKSSFLVLHRTGCCDIVVE